VNGEPHGRWTVLVCDPAGVVVSSGEFETEEEAVAYLTIAKLTAWKIDGSVEVIGPEGHARK
jgi:hypothetical protein